ncbi:MAG TPA: hypothetical protein VMM36_19380 [Opitutaceae bacterium]|nr:hypothetical protein [Opitutaceae bacterium]
MAALALPSAARAADATTAAFTADLGNGLRYIRLSDASVIAKFEGTQVVDLRFADALEESAEGLARHLQTAAQSGATLFVLVNSATDPFLRRDLASVQGSVRSLLFIGPTTPELAPEIVTAPDLEEERRACDAIAAGTSPSELIKEKLEKPRFDEAELVRTRNNGGSRGPTDGTESDAQPALDAEPKPAPLKDLSLQRAVFLHRALIALGRLPTAA